MFGWNKFFIRETKVRLDVIDKFYVVKYHQTEFYATVEENNIYFNIEVINELYILNVLFSLSM